MYHEYCLYSLFQHIRYRVRQLLHSGQSICSETDPAELFAFFVCDVQIFQPCQPYRGRIFLMCVYHELRFRETVVRCDVHAALSRRLVLSFPFLRLCIEHDYIVFPSLHVVEPARCYQAVAAVEPAAYIAPRPRNQFLLKKLFSGRHKQRPFFFFIHSVALLYSCTVFSIAKFFLLFL